MEDMIAPYKNLYRVIEGRADRRQFWMFFLLACALHIVPLALLFMTIGGINALNPNEVSGLFGGLGFLTILAIVPLYFLLGLTWLALATVSIRRLHDIGLTGWIYLALCAATLIPFVNFLAMIAYLVLMALPGSAGPNKYGEHPDHQSTGTVFE